MIYRRIIKRAIDIIMATIGIIVTSPLVVLTSILIANKIGRPILFKQVRSGKNGKPFFMYKFRSMTNDRDKNGNLLPDEDRMTEFGLKIRKYSIDELPQFFNILKGDMSIIGPRPLPKEYDEYYNEFQRRRLDVKPGIVGLASINGRNQQSWDSKFSCDIEYVDNCSFALDLKIFLKAIIVTLKHESVESEGFVAGEPFIKKS